MGRGVVVAQAASTFPTTTKGPEHSSIGNIEFPATSYMEITPSIVYDVVLSTTPTRTNLHTTGLSQQLHNPPDAV